MNSNFFSRIFLILFCVFSLALNAQQKYSAKANALFNEGTFWYQRQKMEKAHEKFVATLKKEKKYFEAENGLALIAEYYHDYALANKHYERALKINPKLKVNYYKIAKNEHVLEHYSVAKFWLDEFFVRQKYKSKTYLKAKVLQNSIFLALKFEKEKKSEKVLLSDSVNTLNDEYLPTINIDASTLIFTKAYRNSTNQMTEDFFSSSKNKFGDFSKAKLLEGPFNTPENEGAICITADGKTIIYTACGRTDSYGSCDLYQSDFVNGNWTEPVNMGEQINSKFWESQPSISSDGKRLYFVSNRSGGLGNRDIWFCEKDEHGEWSYPTNCGANVNTAYDEMSPFIHWDNKHFYFASKGHPGIGGYDLFVNQHLVEDKRFTKPKNLQFPINTPLDNNGLVIEQNGYSAYYISEQIRDSILNHDIYAVELSPEFRSDTVHFLNAVIVDDKTNKPVDAEVEIIRKRDAEVIYKQHTKYGRFFTCLKQSEDYSVFINKTGYLHFSEFLAPPKLSVKKWNKAFRLKPLGVGEHIVLKNIFFKFDSDEMVESSKSELSKIEELLNENPKMQIAVVGHTDNKGDDAYNLKLSKKRSVAIKQHLISRGIHASRIVTIGKGENEPIVKNNTDSNRAINRRTELQILKL
ncbi:MAG: OmpA family protein [Flavobacteriales bacterium]